MTENLPQVEDLDQIKARVEAIEETMETVYRPVADLFSHERVHEMERTLYDAQLRIGALEQSVIALQATTAEAMRLSNSIANSLLWKAAVKVNSFLQRFSSQSGQSE